jgi:DUF971 family protein
MAETQIPAPVEIGRANAHDVRVTWQDGHVSVYPARGLRLACPCAGCVDEMTGRSLLIAKVVPQGVHPVQVRLVGRYGMAVQWSDGHQTGIYAFDWLRRRCPCCQAPASTTA